MQSDAKGVQKKGSSITGGAADKASDTSHDLQDRVCSCSPPPLRPPPLSAPPSLATWLFLCVNAFLRVVGLLTRYLMHPMVCKARCALIRSVFCANIDVPSDTSRVSTALATC